jgi:hypothetical protein
VSIGPSGDFMFAIIEAARCQRRDSLSEKGVETEYRDSRLEFPHDILPVGQGAVGEKNKNRIKGSPLNQSLFFPGIIKFSL